MALEGILLFPLIILFFLVLALVALLVFIFWIWMIIDCAKRNFKNENEKIVWILIVILASWVGSLIYYFVIKLSNPKGLSKKTSKKK